MRRARTATVALAGALLLASCSADRVDDRGSGKDGAREIVPRWTTVEVDDKALPDRAIRTVDAAISRVGRLPVIVAGTVAQPGGSTRAVVWFPARTGVGRPHVLPVDGSDAWVGGLARVARRTYLWGSTWSQGSLRPFLLESLDRRAWESVELPGSLPARDLMVEAVADDGTGRPLVLAASNDEVVGIDLRTDAVTGLPPVDDTATSYGVSGAASHDGRVLVLVQSRDDRGADRVTTVSSRDHGRSWSAGGALGGIETRASGMAVANGRFVVTGSTLAGDQHEPAAWSSTDGAAWEREAVPGSADPGWDSLLTAPVSRSGAVSAAFVSDQRTWAAVVRRSPSGRWRSHGVPVSGWRHPGTGVTLAFDGRDLVVGRSGHGAFQVGHHLAGRPRWGYLPHDVAPAVAPVEHWTSVSADDEQVRLIGARTVVRWRDELGLSWERHTKLTPYEISARRLDATDWSPRGAEDLSDIATASAPDGTEVLVGEHRSHDSRGRLVIGLTGWTRSPGGEWRRLHGLGSTRSTYLSDVEYADGEWVVTGVDADNTWGGASRAALWTSTDRRSWHRETGPFDLGRARDSRISGTCRLPGGDLLAVGSHDDPSSSVKPLVLRRRAGTWTRVQLEGLPDDVTSLASCSSIGDATVIDGRRIDEAHWVTRDGRSVDELAIGAQGDVVGPIEASPGGFVAAGFELDEGRAQPVVWLSPDGRAWGAVAVPTTNWFGTVRADLWKERLVVTMSRPSGPAAVVLENLDELLPPQR